MTPTDRLASFRTGLATNSDSGERVPQGHNEQYACLGAVPMSDFSVAWLLDRERLR